MLAIAFRQSSNSRGRLRVHTTTVHIGRLSLEFLVVILAWRTAPPGFIYGPYEEIMSQFGVVKSDSVKPGNSTMPVAKACSQAGAELTSFAWFSFDLRI